MFHQKNFVKSQYKKWNSGYSENCYCQIEPLWPRQGTSLFIEEDFSVDFVIVLINVFKTDKPCCLLIDQDDVCHITICTITEPFAVVNFYLAA